MRKLYWITFFFGILVISVVTILVEATVNYYSGAWNIYAVGKVVTAIYVIGIIVGIITKSNNGI